MRRISLVLLYLLIGCSASFAASFNWVFTPPGGGASGSLGSTSWQYCSSGTQGSSVSCPSGAVKVTAYGYASSAPATLYSKNDGGDEVGLGITGSAADNEIQTIDFVQLDLGALEALHPTQVLLAIGSVQAGESWTITKSNTLGTAQAGGTSAMTGTTDYPGTIDITSLVGGYRYISVSAHAADVLASSLSATTAVPEPSSLLLIVSGLTGLAVRRKRFAARS